MACEYICDGCGKRAQASFGESNWFKPTSWFQRTDSENRRHLEACSRECIKKVAEKHGGHTVVLPI